MAHKKLLFALSMIVAASPVLANDVPTTGAPSGTASTRYCMHVGPVTGSLVEDVECWTRDQWAEQGVDVDKEWAKEGVKVLG